MLRKAFVPVSAPLPVTRMTTSMRETLVPGGAGGRSLTETRSPGTSTRRPVSSREEVLVMRGVGVEEGGPRVHHQLAQQPGFRELVQGVVDRGEGDSRLLPQHLRMQLGGGDMPVRPAEEPASEDDALARGPQAGLAQARRSVAVRQCRHLWTALPIPPLIAQFRNKCLGGHEFASFPE